MAVPGAARDHFLNSEGGLPTSSSFHIHPPGAGVGDAQYIELSGSSDVGGVDNTPRDGRLGNINENSKNRNSMRRTTSDEQSSIGDDGIRASSLYCSIRGEEVKTKAEAEAAAFRPPYPHPYSRNSDYLDFQHNPLSTLPVQQSHDNYSCRDEADVAGGGGGGY